MVLLSLTRRCVSSCGPEIGVEHAIERPPGHGRGDQEQHHAGLHPNHEPERINPLFSRFMPQEMVLLAARLLGSRLVVNRHVGARTRGEH
jgi:hypothetical protein